MRKLVVKEWLSLDGIIDSNSMDTWYLPFHSDERADIIRNSILESDAMLYGKTTYEMLASYWPMLKNNEMGVADKLNSVNKYVVSTTMKKADWENTTIIDKNVIEQIASLKNMPGKQILLDGSATLVQSLMASGLIDEFHLMVHPYFMGKGKSFYQIAASTSLLFLTEARQISKGVVLLNYKTKQ